MIVWFQCSLLILYNAGNIIFIITWLFSSIRDIIYSLFQKYNALSATCNDKKGDLSSHNKLLTKNSSKLVQNVVWITWKCGEDTQRATCLNKGSCILTNWLGSITSSISSISPRNITSFWLHVLGQNLRRPRTTGSVKVASFSKNCTTQ